MDIAGLRIIFIQFPNNILILTYIINLKFSLIIDFLFFVSCFWYLHQMYRHVIPIVSV